MRDFRFLGAQQIDLADHFSFAWRRGENVEVSAGDIDGLFRRFGDLQERARVRTGQSFAVVTIQEAGLDGFWIHRLLEREGIESWVVDPASILTSRRRRRAKTDRIDGETLVRTLLAHKRGEPRVCAMLQAPTPEDEDRRRLCRERKVLAGLRYAAGPNTRGRRSPPA